jgi:hypothetical protein
MSIAKQFKDLSRNGLELPDAHMRALKILFECIPPEKFNWILTGSASLRLQGVDVPVHDLDIECTPQDIRKIEQALSEYITTPVHLWESDRIRSLDGKAQIGEVEIEIISGLEVLKPDGNWKRLIDFDQKIWLECQGLQVPLLPLEVEAIVYKEMGRDEKAILILKTIHE